MKKSTLLFFLALIIVNVSSAQFRVVGYMPSWAGSVNSIQYSKLTHINYAFLLPTSTGGLQAIENPSKLQSLVTLAHNNGKKVLIAVGGWNNGNDGAFESLAANAGYRNAFVTNMINFVNQYNLDGIDIDWEYPDAGASANNYATLMQQLSTEMHNRGKLLTAAVVAINGGSILSSVFNMVDFLNLMAYDANSYDHSTYSYAQQSINYWKGRGLPASKVVLGVPFYGRPTWESFAALVARGASPNADIFSGVGYNGIPTIKSKTNLAFDQGNGIMIWELSQDATGGNSLLSAIHEVVLQRTGSGGSSITIQAESYNSMSGVQVETCTDAGGGQNVGYIDATDWMAFYNINFPVTGSYKVEYRVASLSGGGTLSLDLNAGSIQLGALAVPSTGGWQNWTTITHNVTVNAGTYNVGVYAQAGGWNLNWIKITRPSGARQVTTTTEAPATRQAERLQRTGNWVLYPNPAKHRLNILAGEDLAGGIIRVMDLAGRQVIAARAATYQLDISKLAPGVYTLVFIGKDRSVTKQFVKE
ncbi:glycosyl hydrolase family 18 protein [Paraflavitalea pollutisoli]|uniref:glycosyl hydrolase family 18 protein n=1 Tax=Paraflavitalea pollutisoli TaxID=3034143 RepID=UPI0023EB0D05|nr:glycosyl hydrolase family 18 protein [Paraflavitalea sp. H1-2-19X]